jgi:hypothetical protein
MVVHQASITATILFGDTPEPEVVRLPGDHRKTDRLDAVHLAQQYRSDHLTAVTVPNVDQEAVRHLVRAQLFMRRQIVRSKHRITASCVPAAAVSPRRRVPGPSRTAPGWPGCGAS